MRSKKEKVHDFPANHQHFWALSVQLDCLKQFLSNFYIRLAIWEIWETDWSIQQPAKTAWTMACGTTPEQDSTDSTIVTGTLSDRIFSSSLSPWWFMAYSWLSSRTVPESEWKYKQNQNPNRRTSIEINVSQSKRQHRTLKLYLFSGLSAWVSTNLSSPPGLPDIFQDTMIIMIFTPKYRRFPQVFNQLLPGGSATPWSRESSCSLPQKACCARCYLHVNQKHRIISAIVTHRNSRLDICASEPWLWIGSSMEEASLRSDIRGWQPTTMIIGLAKLPNAK